MTLQIAPQVTSFIFVIICNLQLLLSAAHGSAFSVTSHAELSSLEASSGDLHVVSRRLLSIDDKEVMWPSKGGRGLAHMVAPGNSEQTPARHLQGQKGPCVRSLLHIVEPVAMREWRQCFDLKLNSSNLKVAGAVFAANLECWCEKNVQPVLEEYGCRDHSDFALLFQADCKPDCTTAKAKKCVADCPAVCLESDYALDFCRDSCSPCLAEIKCITDHSKKMTGTHPDNPLICDDIGFDASPNWQNWRKCYTDQPKRTHWHRHNAENYCYCENDLKKAASDNHCCNATWGKTLCDSQCADAKANINCSSADAQSCMQVCNTMCTGLHLQTVTTECTGMCLSKTASCAKYSICKPVGHFEFDYVCDNGEKPTNDGCCPGPRAGTVGCPTMCDSGAPHYPVHVAVGIAGQHGLECQCNGCPSSKDEGVDKLSKTLVDDLWIHGVATLATIAKEVGILGANRKMQELMKERNEEIMKLHAESAVSEGAAFQMKVDSIVAKYRELIVVEAQRFKAAGEKPEGIMKPGVDDDSLLEEPEGRTGKGGKKDGGMIVIIVAASVSGLALLMCLLGLVYKFGQAKGGKHINTANTGDMIPVDGDSNVVLGRPVEAGVVQGETALGGVVQPSVGGKGDNSAAAEEGPSKV